MSEEAFNFFDTDRFFEYITVSDEYRYNEDAILNCLTNERSDLCHDHVINKRGLGSQISTVHTLICGVFVIRVDIPRGGWSVRESDSIDHRGRGAR